MHTKFKVLISFIVVLSLISCGNDEDKKINSENKEVKESVSRDIEYKFSDEIKEKKRQDPIEKLPKELQGEAKKVNKVNRIINVHKSKIKDTIEESDRIISEMERKLKK